VSPKPARFDEYDQSKFDSLVDEIKLFAQTVKVQQLDTTPSWDCGFYRCEGFVVFPVLTEENQKVLFELKIYAVEPPSEIQWYLDGSMMLPAEYRPSALERREMEELELAPGEANLRGDARWTDYDNADTWDWLIENIDQVVLSVFRDISYLD